MFFEMGLDSPNHIDPVRQIRPGEQTLAEQKIGGLR